MENEMKKTKRFYSLLTLASFLIILLPVGVANVVFGYVFKDNPCILCWGQREAMIFIGVMALFIVRYGLKPKYLAMIFLMGAFGLYQSFAHLGGHAHRDIDQGFGPMIAGVHTYGWAEFVFWVVIVVMSLLLVLAPKFSTLESEAKGGVRELSKKAMGAFIVSAVIIASNVFQALTNTGIPPFMGQSDPVRFSLNPKYIIWSTDAWKETWHKFSILGPRDVDTPDYAFQSSKMTFNHDASQSPFEAINKALQIKDQKILPIVQPLNSLNFMKGEYVASSKYDVFFLNPQFDVKDSLRIDPYYSATIAPIVGVSAFGEDKYILMGANKTFLRFIKNPNANDAIEYANFTQGANHFQAQGEGLGRGRISTVRAKFHYIQSLANDGKYLYFASVPNKNNHKDLVISSVLLSDFMLSSEFEPNANLKPNRYLGELYITSMVQKQGVLYALSKNYNLIVKIDLASQKVIDVISYPAEITNARALILGSNSQMLILSYQDGKNILFTLE